MNIVQCIISRHFMCDKKFHVVPPRAAPSHQILLRPLPEVDRWGCVVVKVTRPVTARCSVILVEMRQLLHGHHPSSSRPPCYSCSIG